MVQTWFLLGLGVVGFFFSAFTFKERPMLPVRTLLSSSRDPFTLRSTADIDRADNALMKGLKMSEEPGAGEPCSKGTCL